MFSGQLLTRGTPMKSAVRLILVNAVALAAVGGALITGCAPGPSAVTASAAPQPAVTVTATATPAPSTTTQKSTATATVTVTAKPSVSADTAAPGRQQLITASEDTVD